MPDICHVCKLPIVDGQARYGVSVDPCHWDCRPVDSMDRRLAEERKRLNDVMDNFDNAIAAVRRRLMK